MQKPSRLLSIDQYRGFAIFLMVAANFMGGYNNIPAYLKHARDIGLTAIDLIAPFFIFAIGLTYASSLRRRISSQGLKAALAYFVRRWLVIIGLGALMVAGEIAFYDPTVTNWGVLQAIGVAGLLTLPALFLPTWVRALTGAVLLAIYQVMLDHFWLDSVLSAPHGGFFGAVGWSAMLILSTVLADVFLLQPDKAEKSRGRRFFPWLSALTLAVGIALAVWVPVSKNRVSASYVLVTLAASALLFWLFHLLCDRRSLSLDLLSVWGENPMAMYVLHLVLLGFYVLPPIPGWHENAPLWLIILQGLVLVAALSWIGRLFRRRSWIFRL
jgi:predicted acyltransferase